MDRKLIVFGVVGALGSFFGGLFGEILLALTSEPSQPTQESPPQAVCLLIDCSGSMSSEGVPGESKLESVQLAAQKFASRQKLPENKIAVIGFESESHVTSSLTGDISSINNAINALTIGGSTGMATGLLTASEVLSESNLVRNVLLFTDGAPDSAEDTLAAGQACMSKGDRIIALATPDADIAFLQTLTGNPDLVFSVDSGDFGDGFDSAEQIIYGKQLVQSEGRSSNLLASLVRVGTWTACVSLVLSLSLIAGQNNYLHRPLLTGKECVIGSLGGIGAGLVGGVAGQLFFQPVAWLNASGTMVQGLAWSLLGMLIAMAGICFISFLRKRWKHTMVVSAIGSFIAARVLSPDASVLEGIYRAAAWGLLGGLVGWAIAKFIPNLDSRRGMFGGSFGGVLGAVGFILAASRMNDFTGRLVGTAILGFCIGIMVAIMELVYRDFWLQVTYAGVDKIRVNLGKEPVCIGSDTNACSVYVSDVPDVALKYEVTDGEVHCYEPHSNTSSAVQVGNERHIGDVVVELFGNQ